jgi:glycosyltransferase involved in cell wall biosynthesis
MNIYIISWETIGSEYIGGIGRHILEISKHLTDRNHTVNLIVGYPPKVDSIPKRVNISVVRSYGFAGLKLISFGFFANQVLKTIRFPPDSIVHVHLPNGIGFPLFFKKREEIPLIFTVHTTYYGFIRNLDKMHYGRIKRFVFRCYFNLMHKLEKYVLSKADVIIAVSDKIKKEIEQFSDAKILTMYNGVDSSVFKPDYTTQDLIKQYKITGNDVILLFVGRLEPQKGIVDLISSVPYLPNNIKLLVIGTGSLRQEIEKRIKNFDGRIALLGKVADADIVRLYASADIFIAPSLYEGNPLTVLEAMSSKLPIIASNIPEMREIVTPGVNGLLFEPRNPKDLAEKINLLVQSKDLRKKLGENNREVVKERFTWKNTTEKYIKLFKDVLSEKCTLR